MTITLKPETEKRIEDLGSAELGSPSEIVEQAIAFFLDSETDEMSAVEFREVQVAVAEGWSQAERGEGIALEEFDRRMRAKYGLSR